MVSHQSEQPAHFDPGLSRSARQKKTPTFSRMWRYSKEVSQFVHMYMYCKTIIKIITTFYVHTIHMHTYNILIFCGVPRF